MSFILKHWMPIGWALTIALALFRIDGLKDDLETRTAERNAARQQVSTLSDQIKDQNKGIADLAAAAEANREVYLAGLEAANRTATRLEIKAEDILALPSPVDPNEQCEAARVLLIGGDQ